MEQSSGAPDLDGIFDAHVRHEFVEHDVTATMQTMTDQPYVHNVPTLTGGDGYDGVLDFYTNHVLPHVVVMKFEGGKIAHEHIYWDQASVLVQTGLLDATGLPVTGAEQAQALLARVDAQGSSGP
jgi:carboxymethylenebutenolidase